MKKKFLRIFQFIFLVGILTAAFFSGYRLTDHVFRSRKIPYPFEVFGAVTGLGFVFWAYGILSLFFYRKKK